jgi:hypothetical protein
MPLTHRIKIAAADRGGYSTTGAIAITAANPMRFAAAALLEKGADPLDRLHGEWAGCSITAVALHRLARPYSPPRTDHKRGAVALNVD